ncbi:MAG: ribosome maturation factor RimP [Bacilli bacterium]|nr:ribosome maturation factor RimP [Bacilli bacterium]MBP3635469.1 ribosome maturation factor RimP [Bacilli bacterium]
MLDTIKQLVEMPLKKEKIDVIDVYFEDEKGVNNLYIIIDKKPYVDIDTCVLATNIINPLLDEADLIEDSYVLNVCSKGGE